MDFALSDEQRDFQRAVAGFAQARLASDYAADDRRGGYRREAVGELAALGLTGLRIPERYGGQGAGAVTSGLALEQLARVNLNAAYLALVPMLVAEVLVSAADGEQRARLLAPIAAGDLVPAFCLSEPEHGSDAARLATSARRAPDGWRLTGEKTSISLGMTADTALVFARTGSTGVRGIGAFYVQLDERHVTRSPFRDLGSRAIGRAALRFDELPAGADTLIGGPGDGFRRCMKGFEMSRAMIGLMCVGCAQQALDEALEYARRRRAFGRPIGRMQGVAFPLVEAATLLRGARWVCYEALWRKDRGLPHATEANMAKWWAPQLAVDVAHRALLTLGHPGYSEDLPAAQRLRDLIGLEIADGTAQIAKLVVARELLGRPHAP